MGKVNCCQRGGVTFLATGFVIINNNFHGASATDQCVNRPKTDRRSLDCDHHFFMAHNFLFTIYNYRYICIYIFRRELLWHFSDALKKSYYKPRIFSEKIELPWNHSRGLPDVIYIVCIYIYIYIFIYCNTNFPRLAFSDN